MIERNGDTLVDKLAPLQPMEVWSDFDWTRLVEEFPLIRGCNVGILWAAQDSNPVRRIKSPVLYPLS